MTLAWASASAAPTLRDIDVAGTAAISSVVHLCSIHFYVCTPVAMRNHFDFLCGFK